MMQQGYKKLRMQPGKWWPTCSSSVPASPFTYICPATFPIKDYLGKTSSVTAACSSRSHYQVAGGAESMPKSCPLGHRDQNTLSQEKEASSQAPSHPQQLLPGLSPLHPSAEAAPTPRCKQKPQHLQAAD